MRGGPRRPGRASGRRGPRGLAAFLGAIVLAGLALILAGGQSIGPRLVSEFRYQQARDARDAMDAGGSSEKEARKWANPNQAAWLSVDGTPIDYPVAQGAEQEPGFYLAHDLWGQPSQVGCPYLDWRCSVADTHALIYGHRVGTTDLQFSPIANAWDQGVFDALGAATLETRTDTKSYVPCFALKVEKSYEQIQRFSMNRDELRSWLEDMLGEASAASPRAQDLCRHATKALTLATCASSQAGQRERTLLVFVGTSA